MSCSSLQTKGNLPAPRNDVSSRKAPGKLLLGVVSKLLSSTERKEAISADTSGSGVISADSSGSDVILAIAFLNRGSKSGTDRTGGRGLTGVWLHVESMWKTWETPQSGHGLARVLPGQLGSGGTEHPFLGRNGSSASLHREADFYEDLVSRGHTWPLTTTVLRGEHVTEGRKHEDGWHFDLLP